MPSETSRTPTDASQPDPRKADAATAPGSPSTNANPANDVATAPEAGRRQTWAPLRPTDHLFILLSLAYAAFLVVPALPHGVFMGDAGELQLAAETLGITHAPGYPGYVTIGYLATLLPGDHSTFEVTLAFTLTGLVVLWLCMMCQIRLGLCAPVACLVSLTMLTHPRMWWSLLAPEVYFLSLAFTAGSVYLLIKYAQMGRRRDLWWAAICYGVALANRPPLLFMLPFILAGWWAGWRRQEATRLQATGRLRPMAWGRSLGLATLGAALPGLYSLAYLYVRDIPRHPYNYIENWNQEHDRLPDTGEGVTAKLERIVWHTSGREFNYAFGNTLSGVLRKLKWVRNEFFLYRTSTLCVVLGVVLLGLWLTFRTSPTGGVVLLGMVFSTLAFVCSYRMWGQAADLLPMIWACTVLVGVALSPVLQRGADRWRQVLAIVACLACLPLIHQSATERLKRNPTGDAEEFLAQMDMETLPPNSVICVSWPEAPPVIYERWVRSSRSDIDVIFASVEHWPDALGRYQGRPIFAASPLKSFEGYRLTPYRNLRRIERADDPPDAASHDER